MQKGTDHQLSLTPTEFSELTHQIRFLEEVQHTAKMLNSSDEGLLHILSKVRTMSEEEKTQVMRSLQPQSSRTTLLCEQECLEKLGKSLVYAASFKKAHILTKTDVCFKVSYPKGLLEDDFDQIIGSNLVRDVAFEEPILWDQLNKQTQ